MFRWLAVLCVGLYAAMLIGGQDRGQIRFGLMPVKADMQDAFTVAQGAQPAAESAADVNVVSASFLPQKPLMVPQTTAVVPAEVSPVTVALEAQPEPMPEVEQGRVFYVTAASANVRQGPGKDHPVLDSLPRGEAVLVLVEGEGRDGWSLVRIEGDGVEGYVASRLLAEE